MRMTSTRARNLIRGAFLLCLSGGTIHAQVWRNIGPSGTTSPNIRITSVAVDPTNPNRWLVGAGTGGVFETVDAGRSFVPVSDSWPTQDAGAITFSVSDPRIVYVGTGEPGHYGRAHGGVGIVKSTDGGQSWTLVGYSSFARNAVKRIRVHPANPDVVLAATVRGGFGRDYQEFTPAAPPVGVLKSTDGGVTWVRTLTGQVTALEVDARDFNNQYAGIGDQRVPDRRLIPGSENYAPNGLYRSTDSGQTWKEVPGPWGTSTMNTAAMGRIELALAPSNPNVMYASMQIAPNPQPSTGLLGLWRTDNAWAATPTWVKVPTEATSGGTPGFSYCYDAHANCGTMHVLGVDPLDANKLFAGGAHANLWLCSDCGPAPAWVNRSSPEGDHHALVWAGNRLINGQDHGLWSTIDSGQAWQSHNAALPVGMFTNGVLHPTDPNIVFGALTDLTGIYRRTAGSQWRGIVGRRSAGYGEANLEISTGKPDTDWALTAGFAVIGRTTNAGESWIAADSGIDRTGAASIAPIHKCPTNDDVILTGTNRLWRTNDFFNSPAPSWLTNSPAHPSQVPQSLTAPGTILSITFDPSDPKCDGYAYGNRGGEIRLTKNGGNIWTDLDPNKDLPARPINSIAFDPADPNVMFVAVSSFDEGTPGKPGHVFRTTDARSPAPRWTNVSPPDNQPFNVIVIDPRDPNAIYAGGDLGLWYSPNRGAGWQRWGLPSVGVYDLRINPTTNVVVAFTRGRGAFILDATAAPSASLLSIPAKSAPLHAATGDSYSQALTAMGGHAHHTWSVSIGALPPGVTLSSTGRLTGVPTSAGTFSFTLVVTDRSGASASQTYRMNVVTVGDRH